MAKAHEGATEVCPRCGGDAGDNWFDRSLCPCDDAMHSRCCGCGYALDGCEFEAPGLATSSPEEDGPEGDEGRTGASKTKGAWPPPPSEFQDGDPFLPVDWDDAACGSDLAPEGSCAHAPGLPGVASGEGNDPAKGAENV